MLTITNEDNMQLMARYPDGYFELAIVDPPYGIGEDGRKSKSRSGFVLQKNGSKRYVSADKYTPKIWDTAKPGADYFNELKRVSKNQIIWGGNYFITLIGEDSPCWIVWDKCNIGTDQADCELAYTSFKSAVRMCRFMWSGMMQGNPSKGDTMQGNVKLREVRIHPTQKPVYLYKWLLDKYAKPGDKILDTHLGSGSIAIACHDYGFDLTAAELDTDYYNAAMKRIQQHQSQMNLFQAAS